MMSLSDLPDIDFISMDADDTKTTLINLYETMTGKTLAEGDGERDFVEFAAAVVLMLANYINTTGKMNLPRYSTGDYLTHLGAFKGVEKDAAVAAVTTMRYTFSKTFGSIQTIPAGSQVTAGGEVFFSTDEDSELAIGDSYIDVSVTCTETGTVGNGFLAGQINTMVESIAFVESVTNLTESEGGAEEESEEDFAERVEEAPEGFSVAGPKGAYEYHAKAAHSSVESVYVSSPSAGEIEVRPLLTDGEIPGEEMLSTIDEYLSDDYMRPLTDSVSVVAPEQVEYTVEATYYIGSSNETLLSSIKTAVEAAGESYLTWQKATLGRDIEPQELISLCRTAGAKRLVITSPVFTEVLGYQVASNTSFSLTYGGIEDD
jgi:phage-related baseplate assembly protein